jgi:hypothetical protein
MCYNSLFIDILVNYFIHDFHITHIFARKCHIRVKGKIFLVQNQLSTPP